MRGPITTWAAGTYWRVRSKWMRGCEMSVCKARTDSVFGFDRCGDGVESFRIFGQMFVAPVGKSSELMRFACARIY